MRQHHNTLYITSPKTWLGKVDKAVSVARKDQKPVKVPRHHLDHIVCFGPVTVSPFLMAACAEEGIAISFLDHRGRFLARVVGPTKGSVMLRRDQFRFCEDAESCLGAAKTFVTGKLANTRTRLRRAGREATDTDRRTRLDQAAADLAVILRAVPNVESMDRLLGLEGSAARIYFDAFPDLLRAPALPPWEGRNKRPPRDPFNAVLSFLYSLLAGDCDSALQAVGLDAQMGIYHADKPGRPALALDLMEELRPVLADGVFFTLFNRRQLDEGDFHVEATGAVKLSDTARKRVLEAWQERKRRALTHPFLGEETTYGLVPLYQAKLLARFLRGDLDGYPPFLTNL